MATPSYSIVYWGIPFGTNATMSIGDVVLSTDGGTTYVVGTTANRGSRRSEGLVLTPFGGIGTGTVEIQQTGTVDSSISGLGVGSVGAGTASWVRCSATGRPERFTPAAGSSDVIGFCETDGRLHLCMGVLTESIVTASGGSPITPPTGSAFWHSTSGTLDAATKKVDLTATADISGALLVNNGGTALTTASLAGQANKAVTVNPGETGYSFAAIPSGATTPTGTGFRHVTGGTEDPAAQQVFNADVNTAAGIAITKLATGANGNYFQVIGGVNTFAAPSIALGSQVTGTLPLANQAAPTGTGYVKTSAGAWVGAAQAVPIPIADGGTNLTAVPGGASEIIINSSGTGYGAATNIKAGANFISFSGSTVHASAFLRFAYNAGASQVLMGAPDNVATDRTIIGFGTGNALSFGNTAMTFTASGATVLIASSAGFQINSNGSGMLESDGTHVGMVQPLSGSAAFTVPFRFMQSLITQSTTADITLSAAQAQTPSIKITGAAGGAFNVVAPNLAGTAYMLHNANSSAITAVKKSGGTGVGLASNASRWFYHDGTDYQFGSG